MKLQSSFFFFLSVKIFHFLWPDDDFIFRQKSFFDKMLSMLNMFEINKNIIPFPTNFLGASRPTPRSSNSLSRY